MRILFLLLQHHNLKFNKQRWAWANNFYVHTRKSATWWKHCCNCISVTFSSNLQYISANAQSQLQIVCNFVKKCCQATTQLHIPIPHLQFSPAVLSFLKECCFTKAYPQFHSRLKKCGLKSLISLSGHQTRAFHMTGWYFTTGLTNTIPDYLESCWVQFWRSTAGWATIFSPHFRNRFVCPQCCGSVDWNCICPPLLITCMFCAERLIFYPFNTSKQNYEISAYTVQYVFLVAWA